MLLMRKENVFPTLRFLSVYVKSCVCFSTHFFSGKFFFIKHTQKLDSFSNAHKDYLGHELWKNEKKIVQLTKEMIIKKTTRAGGVLRRRKMFQYFLYWIHHLIWYLSSNKWSVCLSAFLIFFSSVLKKKIRISFWKTKVFLFLFIFHEFKCN